MVDRRLCLEEMMDNFFFWISFIIIKLLPSGREGIFFFLIIKFYNKWGNEDLNFGSSYKWGHSIPLNYKTYDLRRDLIHLNSNWRQTNK